MSTPDLPDAVNESALAYYRAVCASLMRCIEEGGLLRLDTEVGDSDTTVRFVLDRDRASRHFANLNPFE